jgi:hypothetical protein
MNKKLLSGAVSLLFVLFSVSLVSTTVFAATIEVSLPKQLTTDSHYDRNPSFFKASDGTYWLFFVRGHTTPAIRPVYDPESDSYDVYYITSADNGVTWSTETKIPSTSTNQRGMAAFQDDAGKIWVFVCGFGGSDKYIRFYKYDGGVWSGPTDVISGGNVEANHCDALQTATGTVFIFYESTDSSLDTIYSNDNGASWSPKVDITTGYGGVPKAIRGSDGKLNVVFTQNVGIYLTKSSDGLTWSAPTMIAGGGGSPTFDYDPVLTQISSSGKYYLFWAPYSDPLAGGNDAQKIRVKTSNDGLNWPSSSKVTNGGYKSTTWWDMWPEAYADGNTVYLFYGSEKGSRTDGNIFMYKIDWDTANNHSESIQPAIDAASTSDTINVSSGTYTEQINIEKPLTVTGAGKDTTHIVSPDPSTMTIYDKFGSNNTDPTMRRYIGHRGTNIPVVRIASSNVNFQGFRVDLINQTFWNVKGSYGFPYSRGVGILVDHVETVLGTPDTFTNIVIQNNKIDGLKFGDKGDAIKVLANSAALIQNNLIYGYGESAMECMGVDSPIRAAFYPTCTVNGNTIYGGIGSGARGDTDFFGIGFWSGATGSADENTIYNTPDLYSDGTACGSALNSWTPRPVSFTNNLVTSDGGGVGIGWGSQLFESPNLVFSNNIMENQEFAGAILYDPNVNISNNKIRNCVDGFLVDNQTTGSVIINHNSFIGISSGHFAVKVGGTGSTGTTYGDWHGDSTVTVDATNNWWGDDTGPYDPDGTTEVPPCTSDSSTEKNADGLGSGVSSNVDYCPWLEFHLTLTSPESKAYDTRRIWVNASTTLSADKIEYSLNGSSFGTLCNNCDAYNGRTSFSDGGHKLDVRATLGSETDSETVEFFVDSKEPRIIQILPEDGDTVHGTMFYIKYTEENLVDVSLYLKNSTQTSYQPKLTNSSCQSGTNKICTFYPNLNDSDGKMVNFYFEINDPSHKVTSDVRTIKIDSKNPTVTIDLPDSGVTYPDRRVNLDIGVTETVEKLEYSLDGVRFSRLCNDCKGYEGKKSFSDGTKTMIVKATDYAGNPGQSSVTFIVDTKPPKIMKQSPSNKKYTNGTFVVYYTEKNLKDVTLYYKGILEGVVESDYKPVPASCEAGINKECKVYVDLKDYNGRIIFYYFIVSDQVSQTQSKTYTETVDTTKPTVTIISPESKTYNSRRILLNVLASDSVSKKVDLSYSDNGDRFRSLCNECSSYNALRTFSSGHHELLVKAIDKAGNVGTDYKIFDVE